MDNERRQPPAPGRSGAKPKSFRTLLSGLLLGGTMSGVPVLGHDMWIEASKYHSEPGDVLWISVGNGTVFDRSDNAVALDRFSVLGLVGSAGLLPVRNARIDGNWVRWRFTPQDVGTYWVVAATRPNAITMTAAEFNEYLQHDGLPHVLEQRRRTGILDRPEKEMYSKYVKALLQVGARPTMIHAQPVGLTVEIVLLRHPEEVEPGSTLPIQVLFRNRPLEGFLVHAGTAGRPYPPLQSVYTDGEGRAEIRITEAGRWYLRGIHLVRVDAEDHSYESYWSCVTFEVP